VSLGEEASSLHDVSVTAANLHILSHAFLVQIYLGEQKSRDSCAVIPSQWVSCGSKLARSSIREDSARVHCSSPSGMLRIILQWSRGCSGWAVWQVIFFAQQRGMSGSGLSARTQLDVQILPNDLNTVRRCARARCQSCRFVAHRVLFHSCPLATLLQSSPKICSGAPLLDCNGKRYGV
jgi:hypothetical protein